MKNQLHFLKPEQKAIVSDLVAAYGVESEDIRFFTDDPRPFIGYEATAVIANALLPDLAGIDLETPTQAAFPDSISLRCTLTFNDGRRRSAVGVANLKENDDNDRQLSDQQIHYLASSRAIRSALRAAGIDLVKMHYACPDAASAPVSNYDSLLRQVHPLGEEAGLICGKDKSAWHAVMRNRYQCDHANELNEEQLADLAAFLRTLKPRSQAA